MSKAADRIEELEAKLEKAVEALTLYIYETTHLSAEEDDGSHWCKISKDCLAQGRTTLAELQHHRKGPKQCHATSQSKPQKAT